ncbi:DUF5320 domain-containing protein [Saccharicrinis sp. FJH2]|uniref:DUF5320 domain-containing protein n=1 Tax=Saccharicrinis sp. FJH65 TaxID=3344659 RepID=UPI0035F442C1
MPGLNGKGPEGKGSGTGRGMGRCKSRNTSSDDLIDREADQGSGAKRMTQHRNGLGCANDSKRVGRLGNRRNA